VFFSLVIPLCYQNDNKKIDEGNKLVLPDRQGHLVYFLVNKTCDPKTHHCSIASGGDTTRPVYLPGVETTSVVDKVGVIGLTLNHHHDCNHQ